MWALVSEEDDHLSVAPQYNTTYKLYLASMVPVTRPDRRKENDFDLLRIWLLQYKYHVDAGRLLC